MASRYYLSLNKEARDRYLSKLTSVGLTSADDP
jgi:hypothetical protein